MAQVFGDLFAQRHVRAAGGAAALEVRVGVRVLIPGVASSP